MEKMDIFWVGVGSTGFNLWQGTRCENASDQEKASLRLVTYDCILYLDQVRSSHGQVQELLGGFIVSKKRNVIKKEFIGSLCSDNFTCVCACVWKVLGFPR
jgi:hypothetical protein